MTHSWELGPARPDLGVREVHVWRVDLDAPDVRVARQACVLSEDERDRAAAFRRRRDARRFVVAHAALRHVIGRYLDVEPEGLRFERGVHGKPRLCADHASDLRFNLSHSVDLALCAVAREREVGVDVERLAPELADFRVAETAFSPSDVALLRGLPEASRPTEFLSLWTRKEATLKATGDGIAAPHGLPAGEITVKMLAPGPHYVGAVASEGDVWDLTCWHWMGACP